MADCLYCGDGAGFMTVNDYKIINGRLTAVGLEHVEWCIMCPAGQAWSDAFSETVR